MKLTEENDLIDYLVSRLQSEKLKVLTEIFNRVKTRIVLSSLGEGVTEGGDPSALTGVNTGSE